MISKSGSTDSQIRAMIIWKNWTIWSRWNAHTIEVSRNYDSYWIWRLELGLWNDGATVTSTVTDPIWWLYDDDSFKILVTETLFSAMNRTPTVESGPTSQSCHQHISSPISMLPNLTHFCNSPKTTLCKKKSNSFLYNVAMHSVAWL